MRTSMKSKYLAVLLTLSLAAAWGMTRADDRFRPPPDDRDSHGDYHPPPAPPTPYPAIPLPPYPYPTLTQPRPMPTFSAPPPRPQKSPTHPAYPGKGKQKKRDKKTASAGKTAPALPPMPDPDWPKVVKRYEGRFAAYQRKLDGLLAGYGGDWEAMMNDPKGRAQCETILKRWGEDEKRLVALYRKATDGITAVGKPDGKEDRSKHDEELNASDIDG